MDQSQTETTYDPVVTQNYTPKNNRVLVRPLGIPNSWNYFDIQMKIQGIYDHEHVVLVSTYMANGMLMGIFTSA